MFSGHTLTKGLRTALDDLAATADLAKETNDLGTFAWRITNDAVLCVRLS